MTAQVWVFIVLGAALVLFVWGKWRYDVVALLALMAVVLPGIVAADAAFSGFSHPAVITVAAVLLISRGLSNAGVVDLLAGWLSKVPKQTELQLLALTGVVAICSAFMNNVGALALLLPVAIRMARDNGQPASLFLMPLAFGSLLGGLCTMIGTPPNIIIATFRATDGGEAFGMFSFAPVGLGVTVAGLLFIVLAARHILPERKGEASPEELFEIEDYFTEVRVPEKSKLAGQMLRDIHGLSDADVAIIGLVRGDQIRRLQSSYDTIQAEDILVVEADSDELKQFADDVGLELAASKDLSDAFIKSDDINMNEAVVLPGSRMVGQTAQSLNLRFHHGINLLAVARQGQRIHQRLSAIRFREGDVLLWEGPASAIQEALSHFNCLPLANREFSLGQPRRLIIAIGLFAAAIACAVMNLLPTQIALIAAALMMVLLNIVPVRQIYTSIDWPVIILLGAMIPVGQAMETTGGAQSIANGLLHVGQEWPPVIALIALFLVTMTLSDAINNAAAAVLMAPIGFGLAAGLDVSPDPFLMAIAVSASCAFLTPIGHQSNTLVMGPGGYRFSDYWKLGLPLQVVVLLVAIPLILRFWPL